MKRTKTIVTKLLLLTTTAGLLFSCGNGGRTETLSDTTLAIETETVQETTELEARQAIPDELPERDFAGYEYRILTYSPTAYEVEELTGDVVEDAKYDRNLKIGERFNVTIRAVPSPGIKELDKELKQSVISGDNAYDIAIPHQITSGPGFITSQSILTWNDVPYVNPDKPWWNQTINETISILGQQYYMAGYVTMPTPFCMFVNKAMLADHGFDDMYKTVREGKWTIDKLIEMTATVSGDLNGDGKMDSADRWGISFNNDNNTLNFMYASGILSVLIEEGRPVPNTNNDRMIAFIEKLYELYHNGNRSLVTTYQNQGELGMGGFKDARILIKCGSVSDLAQLREAEIDVGVSPYPKLDEAQERYATHVDAWNGMLCIPKTADNLERTGIVIEAMAAETYKYVIPAYYDVALGTKYVRDTESMEMLDIIFASVVYDFGYIFDSWNGCTWTAPNLMTRKSTNVASYWQSIEKKVTSHYEKLYKAVEEDIAQRAE